MLALAPPVISLADPLLESEGGVDPLSLARTYERIADRFLPSVTVRMSRIRFLTAMCLGALVCRERRDEVASDDLTPPWLVYEWYVIEAFARVLEIPRGERIPGLVKVTACLGNQRPVSAAAYLKTPKVFGFSGIFRRLATGAHLLDDDLAPDDGAYELLAAWARDEGLDGLVDEKGPGGDLVKRLRDAVDKGMAHGHTVQRPGPFWEQLAAKLHPGHIGARERRVIHDRLRSTDELTREHVDALAAHGTFVNRFAEADYLRGRIGKSSSALAAHLRALDDYEGICRPVLDAFNLLRFLSTKCDCGPVDAAAFAADPRVADMVPVLREACAAAERNETLLDWASDVRLLVDRFGRLRDARELFAAVGQHHEDAQKAKPPDGKRPWFEHARGDRLMIRPAYTFRPGDEPEPTYVHDYRTRTLSVFLTDLSQIR